MSSLSTNIGIFGKLPAHGDFVQRNLPVNFIEPWDEWLQYFISGTQEALSENWLEIYLTSPIWRFVFSNGVIDENSWAGIVLPSVDRVGRYFPFSIITQLDYSTNPFEFFQLNYSWFADIESVALQSLDNEIEADDVINQLALSNVESSSEYVRSSVSNDCAGYQFEMEFSEQSISSVYPLLLDTLMTQSFRSYSVWQTSGSEYINPCMFSTQGLPGIQQMPAMLNGQWQSNHWAQPFVNQALAIKA